MISWARVGDKVVRFRDRGISEKRGYKRINPAPKKGDVATVVGFFDHELGPTLLLAEFPNPCPRENRDVGWLASEFRPLITKSQEDDISMFKSLLKPTEVPA